MSATKSRLALICLAIALGTVAPARASFVHDWGHILTETYLPYSQSAAPWTFTMSTSSDAKLVAAFGNLSSNPSQILEYGPRDTPDISRLTDALQNGLLDNITFDFNGQQTTVPEGIFATDGFGPPVHHTNFAGLLNGTDYHGMRIDFYSIWLARTDATSLVQVDIFGGAPEPATWLLAALALLFLPSLLLNVRRRVTAADEILR